MTTTIIAGNKSRNQEKTIIVRKNKTCVLGIVLDATISFTSVYPQIYYFLERLLIGLKQKREEDAGLVFAYALTLVKDEPEQVSFDGKALTDDENVLLGTLSEIEFSGGNRNGKENLTEAVRFLLEEMKEICGSQDQPGLLLISDALAGDEGRFVDLTRYAGLRFAYIYSGDENYMPQFRFTDANRHLTENEHSTCIYAGLSQLLADTEEEEVRLAEKLAEEIVMRFA